MAKVTKTSDLKCLCNKYVKENVKGEVDFLPSDKRRRFLQSDTIVLGVYDQACPYYSK